MLFIVVTLHRNVNKMFGHIYINGFTIYSYIYVFKVTDASLYKFFSSILTMQFSYYFAAFAYFYNRSTDQVQERLGKHLEHTCLVEHSFIAH